MYKYKGLGPDRDFYVIPAARRALLAICYLSILVIRSGFEPETHSLEGCCSIQLSYRTQLYPKNQNFSGTPFRIGHTKTVPNTAK